MLFFHRRRAGTQLLQLTAHGGYDLVPGSRARLPEKAQAWVPGTIGTIEQPAPVGWPCRHHPDRHSQRSCQMRDCAVDSNDEVQIADYGGGVVKIRKFLGKVNERLKFFCRRYVLTWHVFLQRDEPHPQDVAKGSKLREAH